MIGTVKDSSGAVVPGASVTARNLGTSLMRTVTTDGTGNFTIPDLPVGHYSLKTEAAYRDIDLHPDVAEYLQRFIGDREGLLFATRNGTPHLHNNIEDRWLTERLKVMGLDEPGMGWRAFKRFRKTWLRGRRCLEDLNNFWMARKPKTMSEFFSARNSTNGSKSRSESGTDSKFLLLLLQVAPKNRSKQKLQSQRKMLKCMQFQGCALSSAG